MDVSRRDVMVAGAFAVGASGLLWSGLADAQAADEAAVKESIEVLRKAQLEADKARLEQVASAQVSYGHSDGRVETKEQFINGGHDPQAGRQVARLPRAQSGGGRQCRRRAAVVTTSA